MHARIFTLIAMTAAALVCAATPQVARAEPEDGCVDTRWDWCGAQLSEALDAHGLKAAEDWSRRGDALIRVFVVDGFGHEKPVVAFSRRLNDRRVYAYPGDPDYGHARSGQVSLTDWEVADAALRAVHTAPSRGDDTNVETELPDGTVEMVLCTDYWTYLIEAVSDGRVSRRFRTACGDDPLIEHVETLAQLARSRLSPCDLLDIEHDRPFAALEACAYLYGRETDAVSVMNRFHSQPFDEADAADPGQVADLFTADAEVRWPDQAPALGREQVAKPWSEMTRSQDAEAYYERVDGVAAGRVVIKGELYVERPSADDPKSSDEFSADYTQTWIRDSDGAWRISRWAVQPFRIVN
ncbi:hypothetical protein [Caulobacter sp. 17J80-11]|uniref:hypothetical protein n=1 Tax=Caulobacter sp. 17J80-11 TaxID=2763502 RepID=UPI001653E4A2|nr:hypothetical protein [Caulobacter sp. 17J80-11]MBC6981072.1 hypothetical protein [Caulobacter sp. 17J80-11]